MQEEDPESQFSIIDNNFCADRYNRDSSNNGGTQKPSTSTTFLPMLDTLLCKVSLRKRSRYLYDGSHS